MRKIVLTTILISAVLFVSGQQLVASMGSTENNSGYVIDWALGEPVIETISDGTNTLTQGFLQSQIIVTAIENITIPDVTVTAFPNPTTGFVNIKVEQAGEHIYTCQIETLTGRCVLKNTDFPATGQINLENLITGVYILTIKPENGEWVKNFKIVKN